MRRPALLRCLPRVLRQRAYYRLYHHRHSQWSGLFKEAELDFAAGIHMVNLVPGDVISGSIALTGFYESDLSRRIVALGRQGGVLVDVGANMGYYSLLWCAAHPSNRALALEASPRVVPLLAANVARNRLAERIEVVAQAASNAEGLVHFSPGPQAQTGWGGISAAQDEATISVPSVRLDALCAGRDIDVLKIDVEGAEMLVLQGCEGLLRAGKVRTIFFEQNAARMAQLQVEGAAPVAFLQALGYRCSPLDAAGAEWVAERAPQAPARH